MSNQLLLRTFLRSTSLAGRGVSTTATKNQEVVLDQATRDRAYPQLGNRDIVGYGFNGDPTYADRLEYPCPAVRFKENSSEVMALRQKEKGDWKNLSLAEKKALYRASFCQTFAEVQAPTGEWKSVLAGVLMLFGVAGWVVIWMKKFVYPPLPISINKEWQEAQVRRSVLQGQGRIEGIAAEFDFEKNQWK
ncbi:cytochrome c oxidase subunit 4 isoform 1, mitochondrial [Patella vulgata]|uniref:cytochrome c oxidase subunit 4 isoform 1, mitochondrial n=1 Tax=Patella vulgata TaxID=6465 RepID=UPI0021806C9B|nr:cytochrome c oxidase subunit 4 isoform 1, mitochondrial [Patella vulgata]